MLFFDSNKKRVDEDLEKIRRANISKEQRKKEDREKEEMKRKLSEIGFMDMIAMIIAAFSVIFPYALVFIGFLVLYGFFIQKIL